MSEVEATEETGGEFTARLSRIFRATPEFLFNCFTDPELVMRWWGPQGTHCPRAENELVVGGTYEYDMVGDDSGQSFNVKGRYLVIEPPERLVFSWVWDDTPDEETQVALTFRPIGEAETELTLVHSRFPSAERAAAHTEGWTSSLEGLLLVTDSTTTR